MDAILVTFNNENEVSIILNLLKNIDDLEIRFDADRKMIHMRSASRIGYSDRGINKKRIERLKDLYKMKIS